MNKTKAVLGSMMIAAGAAAQDVITVDTIDLSPPVGGWAVMTPELMSNLTSVACATNGLVTDYLAEAIHDGQLTNLVKIIVEGGHVCAAYGHNWRGGRPGEGGGMVFADYHPNTNYRTCRLCGRCETQTLDWK